MTTATSPLRSQMIAKVIARASLLAICLAMVLSVSLPQTAKAWYTANWRFLTDAHVASIWEDGFYNYDHESQHASNANVDWPVTIVFTMDAHTQKVKDILWGNAPWWDGTMYNWVSDNRPAGEWHGDRGTKSDVWVAYHMRPYAPYKPATGRYHFNNLSWWNYCVGTTHIDYPPLFFGYSEDAEQAVVDWLEMWGYYVFRNYYYFYNYEPLRAEGTHIWHNNGWASEVMIF